MPREHYIKKLIREGEHQQQDFKFAISDSKKIARSLVAFANTDGGRLLIGVKDNGNIAGVRSEEEFYMIEAAAGMYCKPEVMIDFKEHVVDGKKILEIIVKPSDTPLHAAPNPDNKYLVYKRSGDQNLVANHIYVEAMRKRARQKSRAFQLSEPVTLLIDYLKEEDAVTIGDFRKMTKLRSFAAKRILIDLVAMNILQMQFTEHEVYYSLSEEADMADGVL